MPRHCAPGHRTTAVLLAAAIAAGVPGVTAAAPTAAPVPAADPLDDAQQLYDRGKAKFETADYADAIELWTEAYAMVPETSEGSQIKVLLLYNIATAREKQFDVSRDPGQLRQAAILLQGFEESIPALYGEGDEAEAERAKVQERRAAIEARLREHEAAQSGNGEGEGDEREPTETTEPTTPPEPHDEPAPSGKGLVIGGAVAAGLGVGGIGLMAVGFGMGSRANDISGLAPDDVDARRDQFDRGRTGNTLAIAGAAAGGVLLVAGSLLLGLGLRRMQASRSSHVALAPAPLRGGTGLVLQGRF